jgi:hypothetical protein
LALRDKLRKLERAAQEEMLEIRQQDGTVKRFPQSAGLGAFMALMDGRDHPLAEAARNSSEHKWTHSFYSAFPMGEDREDLSG